MTTDEGHEFESDQEGTPQQQPESGGGVMHHPARQQCPNCGAILGVRAAICPKCGADIRTGAVAEAGRARKLPKALLVLIVLGVLIVIALLAVLALRSCAAPPAEEPVAEEEVAEGEGVVVAAVPGQGPAVPVYELTPEEQQVRQKVDAYLERLRDVLSHARTSTSAEMATRWADLYSYCVGVGLQAEAEQCWYRAVMLRPTDSSVNSTLGRTARAAGVPVTAEQRDFIDRLRPVVRVVNTDPALTNHLVRFDGQGQTPIPWGKPVETRPDVGSLRIEVVAADNPESPVQAFSVPAMTGVICTIELRNGHAAPALDEREAMSVLEAIQANEATRNVTLALDASGEITAARGRTLSVEKNPDERLQMGLGRDGAQLGLVGRVKIGDPFDPGGQHVICGTGGHPAVFNVLDEQRALGVADGSYFAVRSRLSDELWAVLGTAQGDVASEWARTRLERRLAAAGEQVTDAQARGELILPWEADMRTCALLADLPEVVERDRNRQDAAAQMAAYLDRVRAMGVGDRGNTLHLNWPRFREALAGSLQGSEQAILDRLEKINIGPELERGASRRSRRRAKEEAGATLEPQPVEVDRDWRVPGLAAMLPVLPDEAALQLVSDNWEGMNAGARVAAALALERIGTDEAVAFLGNVSGRTEDIDLLEVVLLTLGSIGTPEAISHCDAPTISDETRMASVAGKVVAGDPEALDGLAQYITELSLEQKEKLVWLITQADAPGVRLALPILIDACTKKEVQEPEAEEEGPPEGELSPAELERYRQALEAERGPAREEVDETKNIMRIAAALVRMGGHSAMAELARLMFAEETVFPDMLHLVSTDDEAMLMRQLKDAVGGQAAGQVAELMLRDGSAEAMAFVRAAAIERGNADTVRLLVTTGTPANLAIARDAARAVGLDLLQEIARQWFVLAEDGDGWTWSGAVDAADGLPLLEAVLRESGNAETKLTAAFILGKLGQAADPQLLAAAAQAPLVAEEDEPVDTSDAEPYDPGGYEEPAALPLSPEGLAFDGQAPLYALGMLRDAGGDEARAQLRALAQGYDDGRLKAAAFAALCDVGGEENLLRSAAMSRKATYASLVECVAELETRVAALGAIEAPEFLPTARDILAEEPPPSTAFGQTTLPGYDLFAEWWQLRLYAGACNALAQICRRESLLDVAGDQALEEEIVRKLTALIDSPGASDPGLFEAGERLRLAAIRAFGRVARPSVPAHRLVVNRLTQVLVQRQEEEGEAGRREREDRGRRPDGPPGPAQPPPKPLLSAAALREALLDAAGHMTAREEGSDEMQKTLTRLLELGSRRPWIKVVRRMALYPTPGYFRLLNVNLDQVYTDDLEFIVRTAAHREGGGGSEFVTCLAETLESPVAKALRRAREAAGALAEDSDLTDEQKLYLIAPLLKEVVGGEGDVFSEGMAAITFRHPRLLTQDQAMHIVQETMRGMWEEEGFASQRPSRQAEEPTRSLGWEVWTDAQGRSRRRRSASSYARLAPGWSVDWSYSPRPMLDELQQVREGWELVGLLFKSGQDEAAAALRSVDWLPLSDYGPAASMRYLEGAPSDQAQVARRLGQVFREGIEAPGGREARGSEEQAAPVTAGMPGRRARRSAVAALCKIGGLDAAGQLADGLTGPGTPPMPPEQEWSAPEEIVQIAQSSLPLCAAKALGNLNRADRLRDALYARGRQFFVADPLAVQAAALQGMARLTPPDHAFRLLGNMFLWSETPNFLQRMGEGTEVTPGEFRVLVSAAVSEVVRRVAEMPPPPPEE